MSGIEQGADLPVVDARVGQMMEGCSARRPRDRGWNGIDPAMIK
ncbi:MAG TPA: hypothetical protein VFV73_44400 [Streptosporangiaceae bacterium]|nr:hypothetical protein [Streptosporangiaceae bacterium]